MAVHNPVVIAAFRSSDEAARACAVLEEKGIAAEAGGRRDDLERLCADAFDDGFDVIVSAAEGDRAIALLQRMWPETAIDVQVLEQCPACGSTTVAHLPHLRPFLIAAAVLVAASFVFGQRDLFLLLVAIIGAVLILAPNRRCRECGERWTKSA
jgi:hypothetical protein